MVSTRGRAITAALVSSGLLLVCAVFVVVHVDESSTVLFGAEEGEDNNESGIIDPALMRLSSDPWFVTTTDTTLTQAAEEVARTKLEHIIIDSVRSMQFQYASYTTDQLTRIAEEQVIYDKSLIAHLVHVVARTISPVGPYHELHTVRALEEKLKARIMAHLTQEAAREINVLVAESHEPPAVQTQAKNHLLERTTDILLPQVEGRVTRFVQSRVHHCAKRGVHNVLQYLARSVNEEEKRELLGGPIVPDVDYSFRKNSAGESINDPSAPADVASHVLDTVQQVHSAIKSAHKSLLSRKSLLDAPPAAAAAGAAPAPAAATPPAPAVVAQPPAVTANTQPPPAVAPPPQVVPNTGNAAAEEADKAEEKAENEIMGDEEGESSGGSSDDESGSSSTEDDGDYEPGALKISGTIVFLVIAVLGIILVAAHMD